MRTSHADETQLMLLSFDLLHQNDVDLRGLLLSQRKRDLDRLCRKARVPFLRQVQTFPKRCAAVRALHSVSRAL